MPECTCAGPSAAAAGARLPGATLKKEYSEFDYRIYTSIRRCNPARSGR
jgi:hypothetical protein